MTEEPRLTHLNQAGEAHMVDVGEKPETDVEGQPDLGTDVIAAFDRLTFAAGTAGFQFDTVTNEMDFNVDAAGRYTRGRRLVHVRLGKEMRINDALTFLAADRQHTDEAFAGDILGLHNHGTINIGDTFTEGESLMFTGIPNFAPEMFRRVVLRDPLRMKALQKGLDQLCEEGATQVFRPLRNNDLILGAVGQLQFDVVAFRLQDEYGVQATFDNINVFTARWIYGKDVKKLEEFRAKAYDHLALDLLPALVLPSGTEHGDGVGQERDQGVGHIHGVGVLQTDHLELPRQHLGILDTADDGLDDREVVFAAGDDHGVGARVHGEAQVHQRCPLRRYRAKG